jgi:hypothetical protein
VPTNGLLRTAPSNTSRSLVSGSHPRLSQLS